MFIDSTGRSYSLAAHTLPSARGGGEPLTGRLTPPPGASFECVLLPDDEALYVIASDAGYGFVVKGEDLQAKNKAGKALLSLPAGARVVAPRPLASRGTTGLPRSPPKAACWSSRCATCRSWARARATRSSAFRGAGGQSRGIWSISPCCRLAPPGPAGWQAHAVAQGRGSRALQGRTWQARQQAAARLPARRGPAGRSVTMCIGAGIDGQIHGR